MVEWQTSYTAASVFLSLLAFDANIEVRFSLIHRLFGTFCAAIKDFQPENSCPSSEEEKRMINNFTLPGLVRIVTFLAAKINLKPKNNKKYNSFCYTFQHGSRYWYDTG